MCDNKSSNNNEDPLDMSALAVNLPAVAAGVSAEERARLLNSLTGQNDELDVEYFERARLLLKSSIQTNPKHPHGWIAAARLEEVAGQIQTARQFIQMGCEVCPKNEDVWLEACRLASLDDAKAVIAKGVETIPDSVKLWRQSAKIRAT